MIVSKPRYFAGNPPDEEPMPATLKMSSYRPGPGNELKLMIARFAKPSETCNCPVNVESGPCRHDERLGCRRLPPKH